MNTALGPFSNGCTSKDYNRFMIAREAYIERGIANYLSKNPSTRMWADKIITTEPFPQGEGYLLTRYVFHDAPAPQVPKAELWKPMQASTDGSTSGNSLDAGYEEPHNACRVDCREVGYGMEAKQWRLYRTCLNTAWLCALDVQFNHMFRETLDAQARNLARISRAVKANWNRDTTLEYSQLVAAFPQFLDVINPLAPRGVLPAIPVGDFARPHIGYLESIYDALSLQYGDYAIGTMNGAPLFGAIASRETVYAIRASDPTLQELDKYGDPKFYKEGFTAPYTFHGFSFMFDPEAPRFREDPLRPGFLERVWPYEESATTIGTRWDALPGGAYDTADYEAMILVFRDQFTNVPFRLNTRPGGQAQFENVDYNGTVKWQRIPDCEDEDGLTGRYRMQWIMGAKPGTHDAGLVFIFKRCGKENVLALHRDCATAAGTCPTTCDPADSLAQVTCALVSGETDQYELEATALGIGSPSPSDTLYVTHASGLVVPVTVVSYDASGGAGGIQQVVVTHPTANACEAEGGIISVSTAAPAIGVHTTEVGLDSTGKTAIKFSLVEAATLPNETAGATYTATFGDGSTYSVTLTGGPELEEGVNQWFIRFASDLSGTIDDETSLDGLAYLTPA